MRQYEICNCTFWLEVTHANITFPWRQRQQLQTMHQWTVKWFKQGAQIRQRDNVTKKKSRAIGRIACAATSGST